MIPQLYSYPGISELLQELKEIGILVCIVTSSPRSYCERVVKHWGWEIDEKVCYHDKVNHKPHPESLLQGLQRLGGATR